MIPLSTDRPTRRTPAVNVTIIVINVLVALVVAASEPVRMWTQQHLYLWPDWTLLRMPDDSVVEYGPHLWQFITYQFLHEPSSLSHIGFNMLFLWVFGNAIEDKIGHAGYLCFYLAGGVFAGLGHCLTSDNPVLGASGSVSAVTGLFLALFPQTRIKVLWLFFLISVFEIPSLWFIGFSIGMDLFGALRGGGGVAYFAHIGGNLFGFLLGMSLLWTRLVPRDPYDLLSMINQWNRRRQFRSITDRGYDPWAGRRAGSKGAFKETKPNFQKEKPAGAKAKDDPDGRAQLEARQQVANLVIATKLKEAAIEYAKATQRWPDFVLGAPAQLDLANYLFSEHQYERAVTAYQALLKHYPTSDPTGRLRLLIGLALARYLGRPGEASEPLRIAAERLGSGPDRDLAQEILAEVSGSA